MLKKISIIISVLVMSACSNNSINYSINNHKSVKLSLSINNNSFKKLSSDNINPKISADVKSYSVFLTKDKIHPFTNKVFPIAEGAYLEMDKIANSATTIVTFENVTPNDVNSYYAVVAAFDKTKDDASKVNITEKDNSILDLDKNWSISTNSVIVSTTNNLTFYLNSAIQINTSSLNVDVKLKNQEPVKIDTNITPVSASDIDRSTLSAM